jgi:predicted ATPase
VPCIEASCFSYGDVISYLPFVSIARSILGLDVREDEATAKQRIVERLAELGVPAASHIAYLHTLLSLRVEDDLVPKLTPQLVRERTVEALKTLVFAHASRQPTPLILEDVHWVDKATKEVVTAIVDGLEASPLLLVLAYRPEYLHAWTDRPHHSQISLVRLPSASTAQMVRYILAKPYAARVPLQRLTAEESRVMVRDLLGSREWPPGLEELIGSKAEGNPLFVEELTRSLLESGDLVLAGERYVLRAAPQALHLPTTVQGVLLARIDRLDDDLKLVLQVAAVVGRVVGYPLLAQVVDPRLDLDRLLLQLEDLDFLYPTAPGPQREYTFKHVITQQAVYDSLLVSRRAELHERIGQALERLDADRLEEHYEVLAYHYRRSANVERTLVYLDLANQKAVKAFAVTEAKDYFDEAMALLDTVPADEVNQRRRITLLVNQGTVMFLLVRFAEYEALLTRYAPLVASLGDAGLLGAYRARLGYCQCSLGALDEAVETLRDAGGLCEASGHAEEAGFAWTLLQWTLLYRGDFRDVLALEARVLRMMDRQFNLRWYVYSLNAGALAEASLGHWAAAVGKGEAALRTTEQFADSSLRSFAAKTIAIIYLFLGDHRRAVEYAEVASEHARALADKIIAQGTLAWAWCRAGACERGIEILERGLAILRIGGFRPVEVWNLFSLADGYGLAGELTKARETADECRRLAEDSGMKFFVGAACRLLAEIALATGDAAAATAHVDRAVEVLQAIDAENDLALAYATRGRIAWRHGALPAARADLARSLAILERLGTVAEPDRVRRDLAALGAG